MVIIRQSLCGVFLGVFPKDEPIEAWVQASAKARDEVGPARRIPAPQSRWTGPSWPPTCGMQYERLKSKHLVDPHATEAAEEDLAINNPLSQAAESPWTRYFHLQVGQACTAGTVTLHSKQTTGHPLATDACVSAAAAATGLDPHGPRARWGGAVQELEKEVRKDVERIFPELECSLPQARAQYPSTA